MTSVLWGLCCDREDRVRTILPSDQDGDPAPCLGPWSLRPTGSPPALLWRSWRAASPVAWGPSPPPTPPARPALSLPSSLTSSPPLTLQQVKEGGEGRSAPSRLPRELLEINPFSMNKAQGQRESVLRVDKLCGGPRAPMFILKLSSGRCLHGVELAHALLLGPSLLLPIPAYGPLLLQHQQFT